MRPECTCCALYVSVSEACKQVLRKGLCMLLRACYLLSSRQPECICWSLQVNSPLKGHAEYTMQLGWACLRGCCPRSHKEVSEKAVPRRAYAAQRLLCLCCARTFRWWCELRCASACLAWLTVW